MIACGLAGAGEVPESSLAGALATVPDLVDSGAQAYVHPQRALLGGSRIVSYAIFDAAGFALSPTEPFAAFAFAQVSNPAYGYSGGPRTFQGGLACGVGDVRLGAAYRDGRTKDTFVNDEIRIDNGDRQHDERNRSQSLREFAAGVGFSRGRGSVDLSAEIARLEREAFSESTTPSFSQEYSLKIEGRTLWGGTLFAALPLSERDILRIVGSFRDRRAEVELHTTLAPPATIDYADSLYGHAWNAGLAFEHDLGASRICRVHAHYSDARDPGGVAAFGDLYVESERLQVAETGLSLQTPGWWGETLYLGVRGSQLKKSSDATYLSSFEVRLRSESSDRYSHAFSWGASRSFGDLDLVALVSSNLSLGNTFVSVDATFRF